MNYKEKKGFTLIELLIVIAIIGILSGVIIAALGNAREQAKIAKATTTLRNLGTAIRLYEVDHGDAPADVGPSTTPLGMDEYVASGWPTKSSWVGSEFDWDNWPATASLAKTSQISLRFCQDGVVAGCYPKADWAAGFTTQSALIFCLEGDCRSWQSDASVPGYCLNCNN